MRRGLLLACFVVLSLAGCGGGGDDAGGPSGSGTIGDAPSSAPPAASGGTTTAPPPAATTPAPAPAASPLTCAQLAGATVGTATIRLADYDAGLIQLSGGTYTGAGGTVELQAACGTGDLNGDGVGDALGVVKISAGGTGRFYTLVAWTSNAGSPRLAATKALGDRNPVTDISIAGGRATVVYLTRTPDVPLAGLNVKRTAIYQLSGAALTEVSHTDAPYTP